MLRHAVKASQSAKTRNYAGGNIVPSPSSSENVSPEDSHQITELLIKLNAGDETAFDQLIPLVLKELRRLAAANIRKERPGHPYQVTALVNECVLRLMKDKRIIWKNSSHFYGRVAMMMRHLLVDIAKSSYERTRRAAAKGNSDTDNSRPEAGAEPYELGLGFEEDRALKLIAIHNALSKLDKLNPRQALIVELHFFGGWTKEEVAEAMNLSPDTVSRELRSAKAWLYHELSKEQK